jgi:hypothetical protein
MRVLKVAVGALALVVAAWAAFAPVREASRAALFEIPRGTWARRMSGDPVEILPDRIRLTLGVEDVLQLRNLDDVPQMFGPTLMMPGQSFRLPFAKDGIYDFACTAHASGQMRIIVDPFPATPWARLRWRVREGLAWIPAKAARGAEEIAITNDPKQASR